MINIGLSNFRCFADPPAVELRPITFLVGENSAGKTSFLAAVRQLLESFSLSPLGNWFNRDPYFLGGYEQIAHYKGGRFGRAKSFTLSLSVPEKREPGIPFLRTRGSDVRPIRHKFTFSKGAPQPQLSAYCFTFDNMEAEIDLTSNAPRIQIISPGKAPAEISPHGTPPIELLKTDLSYFRYIFDDVHFRRVQEESRQDSRLGAATDIAAAFRRSSSLLGQRVFASSPIRTEPRRTYTPAEIQSSSEGSNVPLEMARQKALAPDQWVKIRDALCAFGRNSGLFEDIDIRLLGKQEGDPFQILVRMGGPAVNLVDVGYGVSQALPIVYELQNFGRYDVFLLQQPEVHLHPRAQAELGSLICTIAGEKRKPLYVIETHSDYILDRVRIETRRGKIDHKWITIIYFERSSEGVQLYNLYISEKGEIMNAPDSFREFFLKEHGSLLGL